MSESSSRSFFSEPSSLVVDGTRLWVADTGHHRIVELSLHENGGRVHARVERSWGDAPGLGDGTESEALFRSPRGIFHDGARLLVADTGNHAVRSIDLESGVVSSIAGTGKRADDGVRSGLSADRALADPVGIAAIGDLILVSMESCEQLWLISDGHLGRFAGTGVRGTVDGAPGDAQFAGPAGMAVGEGVLWVTDSAGHSLRRIALTGEPDVSTVAGSRAGEAGDRDAIGSKARLSSPRGVAVAGDRLMIADTGNHRIRLFNPEDSDVLTIAGSGERGRSDGLLMQIELDSPTGVTMSGTTLFIADSGNNRIVRADLTTLEASTLFVTAAVAPDVAH